MNTERMKTILEQIGNELDTTNIIERLRGLENSLQQEARQPGVASAETQVKSQIEELLAALQRAPSSEQGDVWRHCVQELELRDALAGSIEERVRTIIGKNQLAPAVAAGEIAALRESLTETRRIIGQTVESLAHFGVREAPIPAEMAEVGILIPKAAVSNTLHEFGTEAADLGQIINSIAEAVTGSVQNTQIKAISSSEILISLWVDCSVAKALAKILSNLMKSYNDVLEVREYREKLKERGLTTQQLSGLDEYARSEMGKIIDEQVEDILGQSGKKEAGPNEPRSIFKIALWGLAKRLDTGYNFDVRQSNAAESDGNELQRDAAETIRNIRKHLQFGKAGGERLLELPQAVAR